MTDQEYIPLSPYGVTRGVQMEDAYILIFHNRKDKRMVPVLVTPEDSKMIYDALRYRPIPATALMSSILISFDMTLERVVMEFPFRGRSAARIWLRQGEERHVLHTTSGIAVCLAIQLHADICVSAADYEALTSYTCHSNRVALPLAALSDSLLRAALADAVSNDRFEQASMLRDELHRRESEDKTRPEDAMTDVEVSGSNPSDTTNPPIPQV